jgi:hypothetical protein
VETSLVTPQDVTSRPTAAPAQPHSAHRATVRPRRAGISIQEVRVLPADLMDEAWTFYTETFAELRTLAVQRHVYRRDEFEAQMTDERVLKYVSYDSDGRIRGLATATDDLHAVPLISPDYFEHCWPDLYARRRIFYVGFVAVQAGARGTGVFVALLRRMGERILAEQSIMVLDVCAHNEAAHDLPNVVSLATGRLAGKVNTRLLDSQSYWLYEFPMDA